MSRRTFSDDENSESRTSAVVASRRRVKRDAQTPATNPFLSSSPSTPSPTLSNSSLSKAQALSKMDKPLVGPSSATLGNNRLVTGFSQPGSAASSPTVSAATDALTATVASTSALGSNRLATGFRLQPRTPQPVMESATSDQMLTPDFIEISDEEEDQEESDDGGMLINIDGAPQQRLPVEMEVDTDADSGEEETQAGRLGRDEPPSLSSASRPAHTQLQGARSPHSTANALPIEPEASVSDDQREVKLADLNPTDLEYQLKYAYFDLDPTTIDFSKPAVCLNCLQRGHTEDSCPETICSHCSASHSSRLCPQAQRCSKCRERGHSVNSCRSGLRVTTVPCDICGDLRHVEQACPQRFFPATRPTTSEPAKLWVSCCICASKSHLAGDCSHATRGRDARWSLKSFAPGSIINLSATEDAESIEHEAANRGLRPVGLKIKGRAGLHNAGFSGLAQESDDNDEESFLRPPVKGKESSGLSKAGLPPAQKMDSQKPKRPRTRNGPKSLAQQRKGRREM
jgi:hypothetical protein